MRKTLIAVTIAVVGAGASNAFAQPTLDFSPNRAWRNAPENTVAEPQTKNATGKRPEAATGTRPEAATEKDQPSVSNP